MTGEPMIDRAVLWDFDRTLVRGWYMSECLIAMLDEQYPGRGFVREDVSRHLQRGFPWHTPAQPHPQLNDPDAWWEHVRPVIVAALRSAGVEEVAAMAIADGVRSRMFESDGFVVYEDVRPVLERLRAEGWHHVVVSNHYPELPLVVQRLGLAAFFDHILTSATIGYEKPRPEVFRLALQALGHPAQVWMVGDNPEHDIAGAALVGIPGILVDREGMGTAGGVPDLHAVAAIILGTVKTAGR